VKESVVSSIWLQKRDRKGDTCSWLAEIVADVYVELLSSSQRKNTLVPVSLRSAAVINAKEGKYMGKMDIVVFGEAMAMFIADDYGPLEVAAHYTLAPAGAEINVAVGLCGWAIASAG
jgi:hypothetical protein